MPDCVEREHFIPVRRGELIDLLCGEKGLAAEDQDLFRQFCRFMTAIYHFEYNQRLEELKVAYAPFDPDADTKDLARLSADEEQHRLNDLFSDFAWLMERANFKHLSREDFEPCHEQVSAWGIHMDVDFSAFERIALFARGDLLQPRRRRHWRRLYRTEETKVPTYQRLVLILKLRPHRRIDAQINTDCVYLKVFKDIPKLDIKMLLPGARVRMTVFDRSKIGFPLVSGLAAAAWNILKEIGEAFERVFTLSFSMTTTMWTLALTGIGYGYRSFYGYQQTKQRLRLNLTQSLYFQNLDNNAGVLYRLLDEAEEQDCREAILAYYFLWRKAGPEGWTRRELDDCAARYLETAANLQVDCEIRDIMPKLEKLRVVERNGDRYRAVPLPRALEMLDAAWSDYFKCHSSFDSLTSPKR
jgi:Protein of unknown function (DUF3754)